MTPAVAFILGCLVGTAILAILIAIIREISRAEH